MSPGSYVLFDHTDDQWSTRYYSQKDRRPGVLRSGNANPTRYRLLARRLHHDRLVSVRLTYGPPG